MTYEGVIRKMQTEALSPVRYFMTLEEDMICVNSLIGKEIELQMLGFQCLNCGSDEPVYRMGHCKKCYFKSPTTAEWVIRPELCTAHLGKEYRNLAYETRMQLQPHIVYLADTGDIKVGITRKDQVPTRWLDQGANQAMSILEVPNRYLSGIAEIALKVHFSDKTNWRNMLKGNGANSSLSETHTTMYNYIPSELCPYIIDNYALQTFEYPVRQYPSKPKSINLAKTTIYSGLLSGIKGQYLLFEDDTVCNIRNHEGYVVRWSW